MASTLLTGPELAPESHRVKRLIIFLHGYGSNGADLLGLAPMIDIHDTQYLSPNAPFPMDDYPGGYEWFGLHDRDPERILKEVIVATPILNQYIEQQMARFSVLDKDVALVGFSQGAMMAMYAATRRPRPLGGVVAISGALKDAQSLGHQIASRPPICIIHGDRDDVVPFSSMAIAEAALRENGVPVESYARPGLGHGIDPDGMDIATTFLKKCFNV